MSKISLEGTKNPHLVCSRCKKEKENEDCLYDVYVEIKGLEGSSDPGLVLEEFELYSMRNLPKRDRTIPPGMFTH